MWRCPPDGTAYEDRVEFYCAACSTGDSIGASRRQWLIDSGWAKQPQGDGWLCPVCAEAVDGEWWRGSTSDLS